MMTGRPKIFVFSSPLRLLQSIFSVQTYYYLYLSMTKIQLQTEIQKVLDSVPESVLEDILAFLKELQNHPSDKVRLTNNLRQILAEDKSLLERLAQ
jgi:hypothetical protein